MLKKIMDALRELDELNFEIGALGRSRAEQSALCDLVGRLALNQARILDAVLTLHAQSRLVGE